MALGRDVICNYCPEGTNPPTNVKSTAPGLGEAGRRDEEISMRNMAVLAALGFWAIWSTSAEARVIALRQSKGPNVKPSPNAAPMSAMPLARFCKLVTSAM